MINRNAYTGMTAKNAALTRRSALNHAQLFHRPLKPPLQIARCRQHVVCVLNWWLSTECLLSHSLFSYLPLILTHSLTRRECIPLSMTFVFYVNYAPVAICSCINLIRFMIACCELWFLLAIKLNTLLDRKSFCAVYKSAITFIMPLIIHWTQTLNTNYRR